MVRKLYHLELQHVAQIKKAEVTFGDLTVFVGPQASGKSIVLQFLKLILDTGYIHDQLRKHGIDWDSDPGQFLDVYLGQGMRRVWDQEKSTFTWNGEPERLESLVRPGRRKPVCTAFYIPAQRVLSLANGWPRPFQAFSPEDPFSVRDFSETFRLLMEQEFRSEEQLFPKTNRLKHPYRRLLSEHVFAGFELRADRLGAQRRLVLRGPDGTDGIPFLAWSAGQREFVPLLMGLYWLMPPGKVSRRGDVKWVIVEEPEMGLHPTAISVVLLLLLELLWRGYRVCVSTHSPHVLDLVWGLRIMQEHHAGPDHVLEMLGSRKSDPLREVAEAALKKDLRVFYFSRKGVCSDISRLDPASDSPEESGWGGLTEFSTRVNELVARVISVGVKAGS